MSETPLELTRQPLAFHSPDQYMADGRQMAAVEGVPVFESIQIKHSAESAVQGAIIAALKATGVRLLDGHKELQSQLSAVGFDAARHLREVTRGRTELYFAIGLMILNAALAVLSLAFGGGPLWATLMLALLVLTTALPVEEFFIAHEERSSLRQGIFLVLSVLALGASFWLGTLRGLFVIGVHADDVGPATSALHLAGVILRYALGIFALASEVLAGWKLYCVRHRLFSKTARAVRRRDAISEELVGLHGMIKTAEIEPDLRRHYRIIGARQYLADAARPASPDAHMRRAVMGAAVALIVLLGLLLVASAAGAEPLPKTAKVRVVLIDLTKSSTQDDLHANLAGAEQAIQGMTDGGRIVIIGIANGFGRPRLLFDKTISGRGSFGLALQSAKEVALADWRKVARDLKPEFDRTGLIGTIQLIRYIVKDPYELLIFSDGREDVQVNIADVPVINVEAVMKKLHRQRAIPDMSGVNVKMLGVTPLNGKTAAYYRSLEECWTAYFGAAGAHLDAFRIDRNLTGF
jgi:hypothetical protein